MPGDPGDLFSRCFKQSDERLLDLLPHCAALSVNAVQAKVDRPDCDRLLHGQALGEALSLDMAAWFTPTAGNYFGRLTKDGIADPLRDARDGAVAPAWLKTRKSDLVNIAEREVANTGCCRRRCAWPSEAFLRDGPPCSGPSCAIELVQLFMAFINSVADLFHPVDNVPVQCFLQSDVRHRGCRGSSVPMLFGGSKPDHIARMNLFDRSTFALCPTTSGSYDERLSERMRVPCGASTGFKSHLRSAHSCWSRGCKQRVDAYRAREPVRGSFD